MGKSCQTFESFAQVLHWILFTIFHVHYILHILDDFIFIGPCVESELHVPVNSKKTVFPTPLVTLYNIEIDTTDLQLCLPQDKLVDARTKRNALHRRKKASLCALRSLISRAQ